MDLLDEAKHGDRHSSVNLRNEQTIEFRWFKGTLDYETFLAIIQLIRMVCELSYSLDERSIEKLMWSDIVDYAKANGFFEFLRYCKKKGLAW